MTADESGQAVRRTLALVSAAVTSMVAIAFLIPLAVIVRDVARDRAFTSAQLAGAAIEPVLAVTTSRTTLARALASIRRARRGNSPSFWPAASGDRLRGGTLVGGPQHATDADLRQAVTAGESFIAPVPGGYVVLQPVALDASGLAVTEVYVPAAEVSRGVFASWAVMTAVAVALIGVSVLVADRLATRITGPARALAEAAGALGNGDLTARSNPAGPPELVAAGDAFNVMAERLTRLITAERVMAADLPHRLRTPLDGAAYERGRTRPRPCRRRDKAGGEPTGARDRPDHPRCAAARAGRGRLRCRRGAHRADGLLVRAGRGPGRACHLTGAEQGARVPVPRSDLAAAADALIGNVFQHTAVGTGFAVTLHSGDGVVLIFFADGGPGIGDPDSALRRGSSGAGSTGLGLDIARRVAESTGGGLKIDRSALGGAQVQMWLRTGAPPYRRAGGRRRRRLISR